MEFKSDEIWQQQHQTTTAALFFGLLDRFNFRASFFFSSGAKKSSWQEVHALTFFLFTYTRPHTP